MGDEDKKSGNKEFGCLCCKCKNRHDLLVWINMGMAIALIIYAFYSFIAFWDALDSGIIINILLPIYFAIAGCLITMSFCNLKIIAEQFAFLKITTGRGAFNIFIGGLFLASGNGGSITGIIMCCFFLAAGIFFVGVGLCYPGMAVKELDSAKLKANLIDASFNEGKNQQNMTTPEDPSHPGQPQGNETYQNAAYDAQL